MSIVFGLCAPGESTVEGGRERKSLGPRANCTDFEIGSVDASERASPLIDRGRESEFDSSPCDFFWGWRPPGEAEIKCQRTRWVSWQVLWRTGGPTGPWSGLPFLCQSSGRRKPLISHPPRRCQPPKTSLSLFLCEKWVQVWGYASPKTKRHKKQRIFIHQMEVLRWKRLIQSLSSEWRWMNRKYRKYKLHRSSGAYRQVY